MIANVLTKTFIDLRDKLRSVASGITGPEEAEDVIQEAFCRLWASHKLIQDEREAVRLSYTAVRNQAIDSFRRSKSHPTDSLEARTHLSEPVDTTDDTGERQEIYEAVIRLSRKALNPRQLEVFELHDIKGLGYQEIAQSLGMTQENVRMTLSRARKIIRDIYRKNNGL